MNHVGPKTNRGKRRKASKKDLQVQLLARVSHALNNLNAGATIMTRRLTTSGTIITSGAGVVALFTLCSSSGVSSATDFANMSGLFIAYRVKAMRVRVWTNDPDELAGVAPPPALVAIAAFSSGLSVTSYANMIDSAECKFLSGFRKGVPTTFAIDWTNLTDAQLWTPASSAIPSSEAYGLVGIGAPGNAVAQLSHTYFQYVTEYETEWITSA